MPTSNLPLRTKSRSVVKPPPAHAPRVVFTDASAAVCATDLLAIPPVEPALKPYQPNQSRKVPSTMEEGYGGAKLCRSLALKRPARGPTTTAPTSAPTPP